MGGFCVKPCHTQDTWGSPKEGRLSKLSLQSLLSHSKRERSFKVKDRAEQARSIDKILNSSRRMWDDHFEKKKDVSEVFTDDTPGMETIPKAIEGEQVVAGWPSWLAAVAGEAISGWLQWRADTFQKLDKIG